MNLNTSCDNYKKKFDIHGTVLYPAVMVAPVQKQILKMLMNGRNNLKVFDPFHGSGTSLYETLDINLNTKVFGYDINPLASLITLVKLQGIDMDTFNDDYDKISNILKSEIDYPILSFYKSEKWFRKDVIKILSKLVYAIKKVDNRQNRQYFWVMLCDIIRRYSNTRSSTYKLHIKTPEAIESIKDNIILDFLKKSDNSKIFYNKNFKNFCLKKGDSLKLIQNEPNNFFDILITSPPYGENATTVTYGQFSYLQLSFIDKLDLNFEGWELNNCQIIDSASMGGTSAQLELNEIERNLIDQYLNKIVLNKQKKVIRFFRDYFNFLNEASRVTKEYFVITLGNRTVNRVNINLTLITEKYLKTKGFMTQKKFSRRILSKRTPTQILVNNKLTKTMNKEYILIMKKIT